MNINLPKLERQEIDWNDLKYALAVARRGGLSQAARVLGTSVSTVARHIEQLEGRLGQRLFLRQQRGYLLTDQGKEILALIASVEQGLIALERRRDQDVDDKKVSGLIRFACSEMLASHFIVPNLPKLYLAHPELKIELLAASHILDLSRSEADIALRLVAPGDKPGELDYVVHKVGSISFAAYGSAHHEVPNKCISWELTSSHLPTVDWLRKRVNADAGVLFCNNGEVHLQAARQGIGIALLPRFIGDAEPDLHEIELAKPSLNQDLWLVYHRDLKASNRVVAMREFVKEIAKETFAD